MTDWLDNIRKPNKEKNISKKIINSLLIIILGVILGVFSKWLDNLSIDDTVWWKHILGALDLGNIFSEFGIWLFIAIAISIFSKTPLRASLNVLLFFIGMTVSYHLYTIYFSGFNPRNYMIIWYGITLLSPILAFICWYGKGTTKVSVVIDSLILGIMIVNCFSIGLWYFYINSIINTLISIGTLLVLYKNPKNSMISLAIGISISFLFKIVI